MYEFEKETNLPPVHDEIKEVIRKCANHLKNCCNSRLINYSYEDLRESAEMSVAQLLRVNLEGIPNLLEDPNDPKVSSRETIPLNNTELKNTCCLRK